MIHQSISCGIKQEYEPNPGSRTIGRTSYITKLDLYFLSLLCMRTACGAFKNVMPAPHARPSEDNSLDVGSFKREWEALESDQESIL